MRLGLKWWIIAQKASPFLQQLNPFSPDLTGLDQFIQQVLQKLQWTVQPCAPDRWRQMVENNRLTSPFRLGAFPGIVDDEGVKIWQCAESKLRTAPRAQPRAFPRQPFGAAVLADMHHGMSLVIQADPEVLGQVAVRWWKIRGV